VARLRARRSVFEEHPESLFQEHLKDPRHEAGRGNEKGKRQGKTNGSRRRASMKCGMKRMLTASNSVEIDPESSWGARACGSERRRPLTDGMVIRGQR